MSDQEDEEYQEDDSMLDDAIDQAFQLEQIAEKKKALKADMPVFLPAEMLIEIASQLTDIKDIVVFGHTSRAHHAAAVTVIQDLYRAIGNSKVANYEHMVKVLIATDVLYKRKYGSRSLQGLTVVQKRKALRDFMQPSAPPITYHAKKQNIYSIFVRKISHYMKTLDSNIIVIPRLNFSSPSSQSAVAFQQSTLVRLIGDPIYFNDLIVLARHEFSVFIKFVSVLWGMLSNEDRTAIIEI
jgi:hypothetical protein